MKTRKAILVAFISINVLFGMSFILLGAYTGGVISLVAAIQTMVSYRYEIKNKEMPKWLLATYVIVSIICGLVVFKSPMDVLPLISSILYVLSIIARKEKNIRRVSLSNILVWLVYDTSVGSYTAMISDLLFAISTIIGVFRFDRKKEKKGEI